MATAILPVGPALVHPAYLVWVVNNVPLPPPLRDNIIPVLREYKPPRWKRGDPSPVNEQFLAELVVLVAEGGVALDRPAKVVYEIAATRQITR